MLFKILFSFYQSLFSEDCLGWDLQLRPNFLLLRRMKESGRSRRYCLERTAVRVVFPVVQGMRRVL